MAHYGGQAVIEGVMMRGRDKYAVAVRRPDQVITVRRDRCNSPADRFGWLRWPFLRGVVALFEAIYIGLKALNFSANEALEDDEEFSVWEMGLTFGVAFVLAILLFVVPPALVVTAVERSIDHYFWLNLIEGGVKAVLILMYILLISRFAEIKRVFAYHGAEHKILHAYERRGSLDIALARGYSPLHPRCGTSFLLLVILVSILLFSLFGRPPFFLRVGIHLALLPAVSSLAYEILQLSGKYQGKWWADLLAFPGLLLQRLTTREPTDEQLEVAAAALKELLDAEGIVTLNSYNTI